MGEKPQLLYQRMGEGGAGDACKGGREGVDGGDKSEQSPVRRAANGGAGLGAR